MSLCFCLCLHITPYPYHYSCTHFSSKLFSKCCHLPMKPTTIVINLFLTRIFILTSRRTFPINSLCIRIEDCRKISPRTDSDPSSTDSSFVCCDRSRFSQFVWKASISFLIASIFFTCSWTRISQNRWSFLICSHILLLIPTIVVIIWFITLAARYTPDKGKESI